MALATYLGLCVDSVEPQVQGPWWATVLGREWQPDESGEGKVLGPTPGHSISFNRVPEAKSVKQRVHLDIYARALAELEAMGSVVVEPQRVGWRWTVMADPEGGEYCAFLRDELPADRLHGLVVDCRDPAPIAHWWAGVYGADVNHDERGFSTVENVPGMPILTMDFVPVPEPKKVKNRIHWDIKVPDLDALVAIGATIVRPEGDEIDWTVMADPDGNEFCAFAPAG
jgi:Glyoxalase-like domain